MKSNSSPAHPLRVLKRMLRQVGFAAAVLLGGFVFFAMVTACGLLLTYGVLSVLDVLLARWGGAVAAVCVAAAFCILVWGLLVWWRAAAGAEMTGGES